MPQTLLRRLGVAHPIIQAPMAGGVTTTALVREACEAGALGFIGAAYLSPRQIGEAARAVRAETSRSFGINLFAPVTAAPPRSQNRQALEALASYHAELGLAPPMLPTEVIQDFDQQLAAVLESGAKVFSFTFGLLTPDVLSALRSRGMTIIGTATTVEEAIALE